MDTPLGCGVYGDSLIGYWPCGAVVYMWFQEAHGEILAWLPDNGDASCAAFLLRGFADALP